MEAPEKIYVTMVGDELHYHMTCPNNEFQESIEYIRTDSIIIKACNYFTSYISDNSIGYDKARIIENFKKYIKGE